jgi:hypothetical protein
MPNNARDLTNQKFGALTVIKRAETPKNVKNRCAYWLCKCDCGNEKIISSVDLQREVLPSCGCQRCNTMIVDLTGKRFGRLVVIEKTNKKGKAAYWLCKCDCGNEKIVKGYHLRAKHVVSCGCYGEERKKRPFGESCKEQVYKTYKHSAKIKGFEFLLSEEYFFKLTSDNCFYCGESPSNINKNTFNNGDYVYNGIDRVDSSKGYIEGNVVPCCKTCNYAKRRMASKDFLDWVERVYNHSIKDKK